MVNFHGCEALQANPGAVMTLRETILSGLANLLKGDSLAAEYLLLHLLSQVGSWISRSCRESIQRVDQEASRWYLDLKCKKYSESLLTWLPLVQIHKRVDTIVLGTLPLNIVIKASPENSTLPSQIAEAVGALLPCSHFLPLSCEHLNKGPWAPRKDYDQNRLPLPLDSNQKFLNCSFWFLVSVVMEL